MNVHVSDGYLPDCHDERGSLMRILKRIVLLAGLMFTLGVQAELINFQEAIEASSIRVSSMSHGRGYVNAWSCSTCKPMRLEITPATIISVNGENVSAGWKISRHWPGGLVIYEVESKQVVRLAL
jgi:hypothetical protein